MNEQAVVSDTITIIAFGVIVPDSPKALPKSGSGVYFVAADQRDLVKSWAKLNFGPEINLPRELALPLIEGLDALGQANTLMDSLNYFLAWLLMSIPTSRFREMIKCNFDGLSTEDRLWNRAWEKHLKCEAFAQKRRPYSPNKDVLLGYKQLWQSEEKWRTFMVSQLLAPFHMFLMANFNRRLRPRTQLSRHCSMKPTGLRPCHVSPGRLPQPDTVTTRQVGLFAMRN